MSKRRSIGQNKGRWLEEYVCGCSDTQNTRKELVGYCSKHGADRRAPPVHIPGIDDLKSDLEERINKCRK
jgi:hypothetical protein